MPPTPSTTSNSRANALVGRRAQGPDPAHHRQPRPAGGRHAVLSAPTISPSATARRTPCARRAPPMSASGTQLISNEGRVMLRDRRRHLRPARHLGGRLLLREQYRALRPSHEISACLPREFRHRSRRNTAWRKRDIVPNINFFMNVPVEPDGNLAIVDGVSQAGRLCRAGRGDGRALRDLQLPADQQSLQRLQSRRRSRC